METFRVPPTVCIRCCKNIDSASGSGERPSPGDPVICAYCGQLMIIGEDLSPRKMTEIEMDDIKQDLPVMAKIQAAQHFIRMRGSTQN